MCSWLTSCPGALADLFFVHFCRAEYQKFVPAYAADNIRIAKIFADDLGHLKNGSVAGRVPQSVVNAFKVVKIDHKHGVALGIVGDFCMSVEHIQHPGAAACSVAILLRMPVALSRLAWERSCSSKAFCWSISVMMPKI